MPSLIRTATRLTLDVLFPPQCAVCGAAGMLLCRLCVAVLPLADGQRCAHCWMPLRHGIVCAHCAGTPPAFATARSACIMRDAARGLVHALKYDGHSALGEPMAALMAEIAPAGEVDLIVPVPLHRSRLRSRGYNQSELLATPLARVLGVAVDVRAARRIRATAPLAKAMNREERRRIVAGAFAADAARVAGAHVLLIDDVMTTGATLDACASALLDSGAASVRAATFARAD